MRRLLSALALTILFASSSHGQCGCGECLAVHDDARRAWEMAALEQRLYRRVEYPAKVATLRAEIDFAETRVELLRSRLDEYEPFTRFRYGSALAVTVQRTRLDLLREERRLRGLRDQLAQANRRHRDVQRWHALRVEAATARLARSHAVDAEPVIEIVSH